MIGRLAVRSLTAHPIRSAVLAGGFGVGVGVMAILLGIAEIVLEQARAPSLVGGGDVLISLGPQVPGRLVLAGTLQAAELRRQIRVAAPFHTSTLYLRKPGAASVVRVEARGGIPSLERALGDPETSASAAWRDSPDDIAWTTAGPEQTLRYIDRFHPVPDAPAWADSWAEWLYFNGRAGDALLHVTFLVGPNTDDGMRGAQVRVQLDRRGQQMETFVETRPITPHEALRAPDLTIGASSVRLAGMRYVMHVDVRTADRRRVRGDLTLDASSAAPEPPLKILMPPFEVAGARGWRTGYVVPVMAGVFGGALDVDGTRVSFAGGVGYHDHNWGFWEGVSWRWGHVQQDGLAVLYGRLFPPADAADPDRLGAFLGVLGPEGPLGYTTDVTITEHDDENGRPQTLSISARGADLKLQMRFDVGSVGATRAGALGPVARGLDFLQLRGTYTVAGQAGNRSIAFTAPGSAETFRGTRPSGKVEKVEEVKK